MIIPSQNPCVFIDETGTGKDDPFFGIGFLKIENPYPLSEALQAPHNRAKSLLADKRLKLKQELKAHNRHITPDELDIMMCSTRHHEFHFTDIHPANLEHYLAFLDVIQPFSFSFCALMVNKQDPNFDSEIYKNPWDYYVHLIKLLCKHKINQNRNASVIVDYMTKPKISKKYLDKELLGLNKRVGNVQLVDSVGCSLIQLCDLLLGAVAFECRLEAGFINAGSNKAKAKKLFIKKLREMMNINLNKKFIQNMTQSTDDKEFNIWHLKLKSTDTLSRVPCT